MQTFVSIDLIHNNRHLCTLFMIAGIKAMSRGISGGKQVPLGYRLGCFLNMGNRRRVCLFSQN